MKFNCAFINPDTDEEHTISVELDADRNQECRQSARRRHGRPVPKSVRLRRAYRVAPPGFVHIAHGTRAVLAALITLGLGCARLIRGPFFRNT